jgi:hypothetical protein
VRWNVSTALRVSGPPRNLIGREPAAQQDLARSSLHPASLGFLISTIVMMSFAVVGVRVAFSLPISLPANWILRVTSSRFFGHLPKD